MNAHLVPWLVGAFAQPRDALRPKIPTCAKPSAPEDHKDCVHQAMSIGKVFQALTLVMLLFALAGERLSSISETVAVSGTVPTVAL